MRAGTTGGVSVIAAAAGWGAAGSGVFVPPLVGPDEPPVLEGAHLRLDPGRRVALVGASGAGKTTVVNLLLRFLDPERGRITLDGRDLREYRQEDVRRSIAVAERKDNGKTWEVSIVYLPSGFK